MAQRNSQGKTEFREPTLRRAQTVRSEGFSKELQGELGESQPAEPIDDAEAWCDLGRSKVTSSIVITMNLTFNSMCRRKKHHLFHWNTLMQQGLLTLIWTSCKRNVSMTIGMSIRTEVCQIRGKASQSLLCWKKNHPKDLCGPGGDWQRFKRLSDQIMCGQKYGRKLIKPPRIEKNKNGKTRSKNSTMFEDWEEFTLLILMTKNTKKLKNAGRKLERSMAPGLLGTRKAQTSTTKVVAKHEIASQ